MFKMFTTLMRAQTQDAVDSIHEANALTLLRQQLRDSAEGLAEAKRAVAVVMAYAEREKKNAAKIATQIADLETRAIEALRQDKEALAAEAASAIAELEAEAMASARATAHYTSEIRRLTEQVSLSEQRLRALQRGKQIADAAARTQKLRGTMPNGVVASLREAEDTLERLQSRQDHADSVDMALRDLATGPSAENTVARLAAAGCGAPLRPEASDVLERLRAQTV